MPRNLWIDAICINQESSEEKTQQVRKMHRIFQMASRVIIWLGLGDTKSDRALDHLNHTIFDRQIGDRIGESKITGLTISQDHKDVLEIFKRSWWTRVWTVQEALCANTSSIIKCGDREAPWSRLLQFMDVILMGFGDLRDPDWVPAGSLWFFTALKQRQKAQPSPLSTLLLATWDREASDPRDHVFAVFGLMQTPFWPVVEPDYSEAPVQTFQKAIAHILCLDHGGHFLIASAMSSCRTIPSWSYDLSKKSFFYLQNKSFYLRNRFGVKHTGASAGRKMRNIQHDVEKGTICLRGVSVGTLGSKKVLVPADARIPSSKAEILRDISSFQDGNRSVTEFSIARWRQYVRYGNSKLNNKEKIIWHIIPSSSHADRVLNKECATLDGFSMLSRLGMLDQNAFRRLLPRDVRTSYDIAMTGFARVQQAGMANVCFVPRSRFNATSQKLEKSPEVCDGDIICILFGCDVPLILRPGGDGTFQLIDAVYVAGIMGGEFLRDVGGYQEEEFVLG
ncbi:hypothetical protein ACN47E_006160 [Coniothyrium glycines]